MLPLLFVLRLHALFYNYGHVVQLAAPGERLEVVSRVDTRNPTEGFQGLKALGVRELTYKLAFLASSVQVWRTTLLTWRLLHRHGHALVERRRPARLTNKV